MAIFHIHINTMIWCESLWLINKRKTTIQPEAELLCFFSFLALFLGLTDRKKARCPKLDFPVRDTFNHWLSATHKKFVSLETTAKTDFQNFALDLLAHSLPKWPFSIIISKPWYNMKVYGWIAQEKQKSIQRQKFHVFFCFLACLGAWRIKKWPNPKI